MGRHELKAESSDLTTQRKRRTSQAIDELSRPAKTLKARQTSTSSALKVAHLQQKIFKELTSVARQGPGKDLFGDFWDAFISILDAFSPLYHEGSKKPIVDLQIFSKWAPEPSRGNIDSKPVIVKWDNKPHKITTVSFEWDQAKNLLLRGLDNGEKLFSYDTQYKSGKKQITAWECLDLFLAEYIDRKGWEVSAEALREKLISSLQDPKPNKSDGSKLTIRHCSQFLKANEIHDKGRALFGENQWYEILNLIDTSYQGYDPLQSTGTTSDVSDIFHLVLKELIQIMPNPPSQNETNDVHPKTKVPIRRTVATTEFNVSTTKNKLNSEQLYATLMLPFAHPEKYGLTESDIEKYEFLLAAIMEHKQYYFPVVDFVKTQRDGFRDEELWQKEHEYCSIFPFLIAFKPGVSSIPTGTVPDIGEIGENIDYEALRACFSPETVTPKHHTRKKPRPSHTEPEQCTTPIPSKRKIASNPNQPKKDLEKTPNKKSRKSDTQSKWEKEVHSQKSKRELSVNIRISESDAEKFEPKEEQEHSELVAQLEEKQDHLENELSLAIAKKIEFESKLNDSEEKTANLTKEKETLKKIIAELTTDKEITTKKIKKLEHQLTKSREKATEFKEHTQSAQRISEEYKEKLKSAEHDLDEARKTLKIKEEDGRSRLSLTEENNHLTERIDCLKRQIEESDQQEKAKKKTFTSLQKTITTLQNEKKELRKEIEEQKNELTSKTGELSRLQDHIATLEKKHKTLQGELEEKEKHIEWSGENKKHLEASLRESKERLKSQEDEISTKNSESSNLQERIVRLKDEHKILQAQIDEKESSLLSSKNREKQLEHSIRESEDKLEISNNELKRKTEESLDLQLRLGTLEKEYKELQLRLDEQKSHMEHSSEKEKSLEESLRESKERLKISEDDLAGKKEELSNLQNHLTRLEKEHKEFKDSLDEKETELELSLQNKKEIEHALKQSKEDLKESEVKIKAKADKSADYQKHIDRLKKESEEFEETLKSQTQEISDLKTSKMHLEESLKKTKDELKSSEERLADTEELNTLLDISKTLSSQLREEITSLQNDLLEKKEEIKDLNSRLKEHKEKEESLDTKLQDLELELSTVTQVLLDTQAEKSSLEEKLKSEQKTFSEKKKEEIKQLNEDFSDKISQLQENIKKLQDDEQKHKEKITRLEENLVKAQRESTIKSDDSHLRKLIKNKAGVIKSCEEKIMDLEKSLTEEQKKYEKLERKSLRVKDLFDEQEKCLESVRSQEAQLLQDLSEKEKELKSVTSVLDSIQNQELKLRQQIELNDEKKSILEIINQLNDESNRLKSELKSTQKSLKKLEKQKRSLKSELEKSQAKTADFEQKVTNITRVQDDNTSLRQKLSYLTEQNSKLTAELDMARNTLDSAQKSDSNTNSKIEEYRKENHRLRRELIKAEADLELSNTDKDSTAQQLEAIKSSKTLFERQLSVVRKASKEVQLELATAQTELSSKKSAFEEMMSERDRLLEEKSTLSKVKSALERSIESKISQLTGAEERERSYQAELVTMETKNKILENENRTQYRQLTSLQQQLTAANDRAKDNANVTSNTLNQNIHLVQMDSGIAQNLRQQLQNANKLLQEKEEQNKALRERLGQQLFPPQASQQQFQSSDLTDPLQPWAVAPVVPAALNTLALQNRADQASTSHITGFDFTDDLFDQLQQGSILIPGLQQPYSSSDPSPLLSSTSSRFHTMNQPRPSMVVEQVRTRRVTLTHDSIGFQQQGNSQASLLPAIQPPTLDTQDNNCSLEDLLCDTDFSAASPGAFNVDTLFNNTFGNDLTPASSQPLLLSSVLSDSHSNCLKASEDFKRRLLAEIQRRSDAPAPLAVHDGPLVEVVRNGNPVLLNSKGLCFHNAVIELLFGINSSINIRMYLQTLTERCEEQSILYSGQFNEYQVIKNLSEILPKMQQAKGSTGADPINYALNELLNSYQSTQLKVFFEQKNRYGSSYYRSGSFQSEFSDAVHFCNELLTLIKNIHDLYTPSYRYQGKPFETFLFPPIRQYKEVYSHDGSDWTFHSQVDGCEHFMHEMNLRLDELKNTDTLQTVYLKSLTNTNRPNVQKVVMELSYPEMASAPPVMLLSFAYPYLVTNNQLTWTRKRISELITPILNYSNDMINISFHCSTDNNFYQCWYRFETMVVYFTNDEGTQGHYVAIQRDANRWLVIDDIKPPIRTYDDWFSALQSVHKYAFPVMIASSKFGVSSITESLGPKLS